ncbi:GNAT family N-acetyltransferase [Bacillaceae bacterium IKA-2]|nr:GNAT family N-acetyltransferase [Bacillaceae bacterium IKA-2]
MGAIIPYQVISKSGHEILLRSATLLDTKAVLRLSYQVISENDTLVTTIGEFNVTEEQQRSFITMYNDDPSNVMIVAEYNRNIIGVLTFQRGMLQKYFHHGSIGMIVKKTWRSSGIGTALLTTFLEWADYQPLLEKLCLDVLASNEKAIALYNKLGFIEEGRQKNQVKIANGHYEDLIIMGKFLNFEP